MDLIRGYLKDLEETFNKSESKYVDVESDDSEQVDEEGDASSFNSPLWADTYGHFGHRFIIHNAEALWNNSLRNLMYKFWNLVEQHQGLTYYMSMSAVKFIRDLQKNIQQQKEKETYEQSLKEDTDSTSIKLDNYDFDTSMAAEMLRKLVGEQKTSFVVPNEVLAEEVTNDQEKPKNLLYDNIPEGYSLRKDF